MIFLETIGLNVKKYRLLNCYTQQQLADILYVTKQSISKWEIGKSLPTIENIVYMCQILRCSPNDLMLEAVGINHTKNSIDHTSYFKGNDLNMRSVNQLNPPISKSTTINHIGIQHNESFQNESKNVSFDANSASSDMALNATSFANCTSGKRATTFGSNFAISPLETQAQNTYDGQSIGVSNSRSNSHSYSHVQDYVSSCSAYNEDNGMDMLSCSFYMELTKGNIKDLFLEQDEVSDYSVETIIERFLHNMTLVNKEMNGLIAYYENDNHTYIYNEKICHFEVVDDYKRITYNKNTILFEDNDFKVFLDEDLEIIEFSNGFRILIM